MSKHKDTKQITENHPLSPVQKNVVLTMVEKAKQTESGILLANADPNEATFGIVQAVGSKVTEVKEGDKILLDWNKARKAKLDNTDYYVVSEDSIIFILE